MRKNQKNLVDAYFTHPDIAEHLVNILNKRIGLNKFKIVIEPSAGNGSFLNVLTNLKNTKVIGFDINPKHRSIIKQNFLTWNPDPIIKHFSSDDIICIGNPPFGRQSSLVKQFVEKCAEFSNHIAFIVPIAYKYVPPGFTQIISISLDDKDVFIDDKGFYFDQYIKTKFVYYKHTGAKGTTKRSVNPNGLWNLNKSTNNNDIEKSHIRITRVSGSAGKAFGKKDDRFYRNGNVPVYTTNNYYVTINSPIKRFVPYIIDDINKYQEQGKWKCNNTTTFLSIDKPQLIQVLNKITAKYANKL